MTTCLYCHYHVFFLNSDSKYNFLHDFYRAMRNRGLEIFLPAIDEDLDENIMDILSILRHSGLLLHSTIMKLLDVHFAVYNLNIGKKKISVFCSTEIIFTFSRPTNCFRLGSGVHR